MNRDQLGRGHLRGEDEVAFVFLLGVVDDDRPAFPAAMSAIALLDSSRSRFS